MGFVKGKVHLYKTVICIKCTIWPKALRFAIIEIAVGANRTFS